MEIQIDQHTLERAEEREASKESKRSSRTVFGRNGFRG